MNMFWFRMGIPLRYSQSQFTHSLEMVKSLCSRALPGGKAGELSGCFYHCVMLRKLKWWLKWLRILKTCSISMCGISVYFMIKVKFIITLQVGTMLRVLCMAVAWSPDVVNIRLIRSYSSVSQTF